MRVCERKIFFYFLYTNTALVLVTSWQWEQKKHMFLSSSSHLNLQSHPSIYLSTASDVIMVNKRFYWALSETKTRTEIIYEGIGFQSL